MNILKTTDLYALNGWILWHANYISKFFKMRQTKYIAGETATATLEKFGSLKMLNIHLPYHPAIPCRHLLKKKRNFIFTQKNFKQIFTANLFITTKTQKQPKCHSIDKTWSIHTENTTTTIKTKELLIYAVTWMNFKNINPCKSGLHKGFLLHDILEKAKL